MTDSASAILLSRLQSTGSNSNLWGGYLVDNQNLTEKATQGYEAVALTGDLTLSWSNYSTSNQGQSRTVKFTGTLSSAASVIYPSLKAERTFINSAGATVTVKCVSGTGVAIPNGRQVKCYCDGTDYYPSPSNYLPTVATLANNNDLPTYSQMAAYVASAISAASASVSGLLSRYQYTATGGETSKSGTDDNGNVLAYTPGNESAFLNGVRLVRNVDYAASTGTSITSLTALLAGDVLEIVALAAITVPSCFSIANNLSEGTPSTMRSNLGLGTSALIDTGTSGTKVPLLDGANTWSATQTFAGTTFGGAAPSGAGITALFASPPAIGGTARSSIAGTTGNFNSTLTVSAGGAAITGNSTVTGTLKSTLGLIATGNSIADAANQLVLANGGSNTNYIKAYGSDASNNGVLFIFTLRSDGTNAFQLASFAVKSSKTALNGTWPTSSAGLATGDLWSNAGVINVA